MTRVVFMSVFLMMSVAAWAAPGDPVVGQVAAVDRTVVGVRWEGTDDDRAHREEGAMLGGFTLFGAFSPGGPIIARLPMSWPPPDDGDPETEIGPPVFMIPLVPDGRYFVLAVRGIVGAPSAATPSSAWQQIVVNVATCNAPPAAPVSLLAGGATPQNPQLALSWSDGGGGCPPQNWEIVAGSAPGAMDIASIRWQGRVFWTVPPPGTYYVRVYAWNSAGRSAPSNEVLIQVGNVQCLLPGVPGNLTASVVGSQVTLNWLAPVPGTHPTARYRISAGSLPTYTNLANIYLPATSTTFVTNAPPGRYYVRVYAGNGCGGTYEVGLPSNEVIVDVP